MSSGLNPKVHNRLNKIRVKGEEVEEFEWLSSGYREGQSKVEGTGGVIRDIWWEEGSKAMGEVRDPGLVYKESIQFFGDWRSRLFIEPGVENSLVTQVKKISLQETVREVNHGSRK